MSRLWFHEALSPFMVPIDQVHQHPRNPRNGDLDLLIELIEANGFGVPILAQRSTGAIVSGNHRWAALHHFGSQVAPVIFLDLTDDEALAWLLSDNAASDAATNDEALVAEILGSLLDSERGLIGSGYSQEDLARILEPPPPPPEAGHGYGAPGLNGIFQVVVDCDDAAHADEVLAQLSDRWPDLSIRRVTL